MRTYDELLSNEPAWPELDAAIRASGRARVLPRDAEAARSCLERLQVTTRSTLGALAHEMGGLLVEQGWLRLFGWKAELGIFLAAFLIVGDDVIGGTFAINGGALGPEVGKVHYFAPDSLSWENTDLGHTDFVHWALSGDLATFYRNVRWPGWETEIQALEGDQALMLYPPPWTVEGKDIAKVSRRSAPVREIWSAQQEFARQLGGL
jgi:hypothetical protein